MQVQSALISDTNQPFLLIAVPSRVLANQSEAEQTMRFFQTRSVIPIALVICDAYGAPSGYYGRSDLATRLLQTPSAALRWQDIPIR